MIYGFDTLRSFIVITPYYEYIQHWCSLVRTRQNVFHKYSICNAESNEQFIGFSRVCRFALTYDLMPTQWLRLHNRCTNHIMFSQLYHISLFNIYTEKLFSQVFNRPRFNDNSKSNKCIFWNTYKHPPFFKKLCCIMMYANVTQNVYI